MLGYFLLLLIFGTFLFLSLSLGLREWLYPKSVNPLPVDVDFVRLENYFGTAFRAKLREWLGGSLMNLPLGAVHTPRGETIRVVPNGSFAIASENACDEIICSGGNLEISRSDCNFTREIYSQGNFVAQHGVQARAIAADGYVVLGKGSAILRWVDAKGRILLQQGTTVGSRVSSLQSVEIEPGVRVASLFAPLIFTSDFASAATNRNDSRSFESAANDGMVYKECATKPNFLLGVSKARFLAGRWFVPGDLVLPAGTMVEKPLVVRGILRSGDACCFAGDIRAANIVLGTRNQVHGNVASGGAIDAGEFTCIDRNISADQDVMLRNGVSVGSSNLLASVCAGKRLLLQSSVTVCGKLVANKGVITQ